MSDLPTTVLVRFTLPFDMDNPNDLLILLRHAMDDFRDIRCKEDALAYAAKTTPLEPEWPEDTRTLAERVECRRADVQQRFDWTRHFQRSATNMNLVRIQEPRTPWYGGEREYLNEHNRCAAHNRALALLCDDD